MREKNFTMRLAAFVLAVGFMSALPAYPSVIEGVRFETRMDHQGVDLELKGTALLRYMVFIKAYVGAIYLPAEVQPDQALEDVPKRLVIEYFHAIDAEGFREATREAVWRNVNERLFARIEPRLSKLNSFYRDVKPGDRYSLTYIPGRGTELALNDEVLGVVDGAEFARAMFSIWIGPQPIDRNFKRTILGVG